MKTPMTSKTLLRPSFVLPALHLVVCLTSYIGLLLPDLSFLGIVFPFVLIADLPVSIVSYMTGWKYPAFGAAWIFLAGTAWWYLLGRGVEFLSHRNRHKTNLSIGQNN